jgi:8-oxo-dGTP pyrophosphatase MutT (NUDIX family)
MIKELSAGLIIFRNVSGTIEFLLLQKSIGDHHWTAPKGHLIDDETHIEAALRETREEAGLKETDFNIMKDFKYESNYISRKGISKSVLYWIAEINNPHVHVRLSASHKHYKWLNVNEAIEVVKYESMKNGFKQVHEYLKSIKS